jgi:hypothetical protein
MPDTTNRLDQTPLPPSGMRLRLELFVEDMDASIGFYTRVLGFEVLREHPGDYASLRWTMRRNRSSWRTSQT